MAPKKKKDETGGLTRPPNKPTKKPIKKNKKKKLNKTKKRKTAVC